MTTNINRMIEYTKNEWFNEYFSSIVEFVKQRKVETFIDLGSCLGEVSKILIDKVPTLKTIIAIEPMPNNFQYLKNNLVSDTINIRHINKAIYYGKNKVTMGTSHLNIGGFSVCGDTDIWNNDQLQINDIETLTLEEVIGNEQIDFIKIDIEGAEKNVIENSTALKNIKIIEIELHDFLSDPGNHIPFLEKYLPNHKIINKCYRWGAGNNLLLEKID